ncbi:nucleotide-diphospho-sugar transferase [Boletus reticuloceps]|uniref:Nucleotide-diphospho-sugar transferase n=1 Tax=Boletus reticuloceps TaxID=495285 RepID=A0A8I3A631_9AGAM|nr:nucleotide-diphospho-sugar transferase [Boletus reticuloceps]
MHSFCHEEFARANPETIHPDNALAFVSDDGGTNFNMCHCKLTGTTPVWSNFEIADMDFWRGEVYMSFFEFLDRAGGFYYEASSLPLSTTGVVREH